MLTSDGTTGGINAQSNLTFNGTVLGLTGQAATYWYNNGNFSGTGTVNFNNSNVQKINLTGSTTLTFSNPVSGATYALQIQQQGSGSYTITWPGSVNWLNSVPVLQTAVGATDIISFLWDGTNYWGAKAGAGGSSGISGSSGTNGSSGSSGVNGSSGSSGANGSSGSSGANGSSGSSGSSGISGSSGSSGTNGSSGSSGISGSSGSSGANGSSGSSGANGADGSSGSSGISGTSGATGATGATGNYVEVNDTRVWSNTIAEPTGDQRILIQPTTDSITRIEIYDGDSIKLGPSYDYTIGSVNSVNGSYNSVLGRGNVVNSPGNVALGYGNSIHSSNRDSIVMGNSANIPSIGGVYGDTTIAMGFGLAARMRGALNVKNIWFAALPGATAGISDNTGFFGDQDFYTNYQGVDGTTPSGATSGSVYSDQFGNMKIAGLGGTKNLADEYVFVNGVTGDTPSAGRVAMFADTTGTLKKIDSSGTVTDIGGGGGGSSGSSGTSGISIAGPTGPIGPTGPGGGGGGSTPIRLTNQTLATGGWGYTGGYFEYTYSNANITALTTVDFTPYNDYNFTVVSARVLPYIQTASGSCILYSQYAPSGQIVGDVIITTVS